MEVIYANIADLRETGVLHEINRLVLHPLGLALEVAVAEDGSERLGGIWDYRQDAEGIYYGEDLLSAEKAERVAALMFERRKARIEKLGYVVQPVASASPTLTTNYLHP